MKKRLALLVFSVSLSLVLGVSMAAAQEKAVAEHVKFKGKVTQMKSAGYVVESETPPSTYFIVNPDEKVLKKLMTEGKTHTFEGKLTISADHLFIRKIDGKAYKGKEPAAPKP